MHVTSQVIVTIICGIQPTIVVTMAMKVLHNRCNMCTLDLTDMYALALRLVVLMPHACISVKSVMHMLQL